MTARPLVDLSERIGTLDQVDERDEEPCPEGQGTWFVFRPSRKHRMTAADHQALRDRTAERS